jgi:hypothetical protein
MGPGLFQFEPSGLWWVVEYAAFVYPRMGPGLFQFEPSGLWWVVVYIHFCLRINIKKALQFAGLFLI